MNTNYIDNYTNMNLYGRTTKRKERRQKGRGREEGKEK